MFFLCTIPHLHWIFRRYKFVGKALLQQHIPSLWPDELELAIPTEGQFSPFFSTSMYCAFLVCIVVAYSSIITSLNLMMFGWFKDLWFMISLWTASSICTKNSQKIWTQQIKTKKAKKEKKYLFASLNVLDCVEFIGAYIFDKLGHTKIPRTYFIQDLISFHIYHQRSRNITRVKAVMHEKERSWDDEQVFSSLAITALKLGLPTAADDWIHFSTWI